MSAPRFCVNCKHCRHFPSSQREPDAVWECLAHKTGWDVVTGELKVKVVDCRTARSPNGICGPDGTKFEPKAPLTPPDQGSSGRQS